MSSWGVCVGGPPGGEGPWVLVEKFWRADLAKGSERSDRARRSISSNLNPSCSFHSSSLKATLVASKISSPGWLVNDGEVGRRAVLEFSLLLAQFLRQQSSVLLSHDPAFVCSNAIHAGLEPRIGGKISGRQQVLPQSVCLNQTA